MKVIREGEWKPRLTCRECSSILQYEVTDILFEERMQEDESFDFSFFIHCPVCDKKIILKNLPIKIKQQLTYKG